MTRNHRLYKIFGAIIFHLTDEKLIYKNNVRIFNAIDMASKYKYIIRDLEKITTDIPFEINFSDGFFDESEAHVLMFLDLTFVKGVHTLITSTVSIKNIVVRFPVDYPLHSPYVNFGYAFQHPNVNALGEVCFPDWSMAINLNQIIMMLYCIHLEYLDNVQLQFIYLFLRSNLPLDCVLEILSYYPINNLCFLST